MDMVYLLFSKAFELVSHQTLLEKISLLGFHNSILGWVEVFLVGCYMSASVTSELSSALEVTSGVPQESVFGP